MSDRRPLATSEQVAEHLGVPVRTLETWAYRKAGPKYLKVGRHRRYRWSDVEKWLDQQASAWQRRVEF
jgi:excisionase family DNA binding protein